MSNASAGDFAPIQNALARPGGFWARFVASLVDGLICGVGTVPVSVVVQILAAASKDNPVVAGGAMLLGWSAQMAVMFFYHALFYQRKGATPGKMLMKLKVVDIRTGAHLTWGQTFVRESIGKLLSAVLLLIGYLMAGFRQDKRALHDLMAGTQVIHRA